MPGNNMMDEILNGVGDVDVLGRPAATGKRGAGVSYTEGTDYNNGYDIDVGFQSAAFGGALIPVGGTATVSVAVVRPFKPKEMRVPSSIAQDFELVSLVLADMSFVDGTPVSCSNYSEVANTRNVDFGTINPSVPLTMVVRNIGPVAARFMGSFRGTKVTK